MVSTEEIATRQSPVPDSSPSRSLVSILTGQLTAASRRHRRRHEGRWWIFATILLVLVAYLAFLVDPYRFDLRIYRAAAGAALKGASVYGTGDGDPHPPFTYPPFALLPLVPFALASLWVATVAWFAVSMGCLYAAAAICLRAIGRSATPVHAAAIAGLAAVALQPMRSTLGLGQINTVLLLMVLADALVVSRRRRGILIGLAGALKLTPLVFLAWFVVARDRAAALRGAATFGFATALAWSIFPEDSARFWLRDLVDLGRIGRLGDPLNQSWNGTVERLVGSGGLASVLWALLAVATVLVGLICARRLADCGFGLAAVSAVAVAGLLVSPVSWAHHWVWVFPAAVAGWRLRHDKPTLAWASAALVAVTAVSPWQLGDVPLVRDAWVIAGAAWLVVALAADRGAHPVRGARPNRPTDAEAAMSSSFHDSLG